MLTPLSSSTTGPSLTRETIDLVSEDEEQAAVKNTGLATSPPQPLQKAPAPSTLTIPKRTKNDDMQDETPCRPHSKRHKSRTDGTVSSLSSENLKFLNRFRSPCRPEQEIYSFTQIPDSEGEEDEDYFGGDSVVLDSDDVAPEAESITATSREKSLELHQPTANAQIDIIVPDCRVNSTAGFGGEIDERGTTKLLQKPIHNASKNGSSETQQPITDVSFQKVGLLSSVKRFDDRLTHSSHL